MDIVVSAAVGASITGLCVAVPNAGPVTYFALIASAFALAAANTSEKADRITFALVAGGFAGYTLILLKRVVAARES